MNKIPENITALRDAGDLYWKNEYGVLYNDDAISSMRKHVKDNSVDLIITSPPYNLGKNHHSGNKKTGCYFDNMQEKDYQNWQIEFLNECYRVLTPDGSLFYNHKNRIRHRFLLYPQKWINKSNFQDNIRQEIVWINGSPDYHYSRIHPSSERVFWLSKCEQTPFINTINLKDIVDRDRWAPQGSRKMHTRRFPIQMPYDIIRCFPNAGVVLDPFGGSGTVALAAETLGKKWILIEKEFAFYVYASNTILMRRWGLNIKEFSTTNERMQNKRKINFKKFDL